MSIIPAFLRKNINHRPNLIKIIENIVWLILDKCLRMVLGLLVGVWVARYLGPEKFGLLSFATAFCGLFGSIAGLGLQAIVVRDIVRNPESARLTLGTAAVLQIISGLISFVLMLLAIAQLRPDDALARSIVAILGAVLLFQASEIVVYWFESQVQSKYTVWVQNIAFIIFSIVKIIFIMEEANFIVFVWAILAEAGVVAMILIIVMRFCAHPIYKLRVSFDRAKELLNHSWPLILSSLSIVLYMKIDQIMLGQISGDNVVGIYSAAVRVSEIWYFIPISIIASIFPAFLEAKKISEEKYYMFLQKLYDFMAVIGIIVAIVMTFISSYIVEFLFGEAYIAAGKILAIHIWASVFVFFGLVSSRWFIVENRQWLNLQRTFAGALASVGLNFLLIPDLGSTGAAIALVISQAISSWLYDLIHPVTRPMFFMKLSALNIISSYKRFRLNGFALSSI